MRAARRRGLQVRGRGPGDRTSVLRCTACGSTVVILGTPVPEPHETCKRCGSEATTTLDTARGASADRLLRRAVAAALEDERARRQAASTALEATAWTGRRHAEIAAAWLSRAAQAAPRGNTRRLLNHARLLLANGEYRIGPTAGSGSPS